MKDNIRQIKQSPIIQGVDEEIAYTLTTTPWGSSPSAVSVVLKDIDGTDVSSTYLSGSASVSDDVITTPVVKSLVDSTQYRLEIKFTTDSNVVECYSELYGET